MGQQVVAEPGVPDQFRFSVAGILSASESGHDAPVLTTHDATADLDGSWKSFTGKTGKPWHSEGGARLSTRKREKLC